jgi:flagellar M-ring protein FliF
LVNAQSLVSQFQGFNKLTALRQVGLMIGLAASVAVGVAVVLWSQKPNYSLLYASISNTDAGKVLDALDKLGIPYQLENGTGAITVPSNKVREARLKLATLGLPSSSITGLEFLEKDQTIGTSRMIQTARYHRALAGELSRTIATLDSVESARVHLAIPKQSVFIRNRRKPSASVLVNLYPGRELDDIRLSGIVHLVASSITDLEAEQVTVIDQKGRLLTEANLSEELMGRNARLKYSEQVEEGYVKHIVDILSPIVGPEGVRAQVKAEIDFTRTEETSETFNPDPPSIRSEQVDEQQTPSQGPFGVPGALTNQPPPAGVSAQAPEQAQESPTLTKSTHSTRNYELDRKIAHTRNLPGHVKRLSVAVVVDYRNQPNKAGKVERVPIKSEDMDYITTLVKKAVGFDEQRGDSVNVINVSFKEPSKFEPVAAPPFWEQSWVLDLVKQFLGIILVLFLIFGVLRPVMRGLAEKGRTAGAMALPGSEQEAQLPGQEQPLSLPNQAGPHEDRYHQQLSQAKSLVKEDPKRVAQVVKTWLNAE